MEKLKERKKRDEKEEIKRMKREAPRRDEEKKLKEQNFKLKAKNKINESDCLKR